MAHRTLTGCRSAAKIEQFRDLARQACTDLFDQASPSVASPWSRSSCWPATPWSPISLAGSLFFSISPTEAKSKVFFYLLFTLAPFAIVSPLLGPLIDRSRGARRAMVVFSAAGPGRPLPVHGAATSTASCSSPRRSWCWCSRSSTWSPEVPWCPRVAPLMAGPGRVRGEQAQYATLNARLTLLGTVAGFVVGGARAS